MEPKKRLGSDQRIRRQTTFKNLVERGQFARGEFFYLWVGLRDDKGKAALKQRPMIGIVVSRKTDPSAVGRNRWKRRVREIFREQQARLRPEATCLVKVRHTKKKPSFSDAEEDLIKLFKKAGAWA
ncbi:MAG: ribonuclease P protein component [Candidatus Omnitrophica bacterium]|nr:ribonuclease P protein component [Candidatus Omnitrophota bacterium]